MSTSRFFLQDRALSRRQGLRLASGATLASAVALPAGRADAAAPPYQPMPVLPVESRHLVNRFSYGITPALAEEVRAAGGHLAWFDQQLDTAHDGSADGLCDWWPDLHLDAVTLWQRNVSGVRSGSSVMWDYGRRSVVRRLTSPRPVLEVMHEFWENHFHVPIIADNIFPLRAPYGDVIRKHALGRFEDLLTEAVLHPAMLMYLGAATSTKRHPNENLGRELLELHTVGVGNYSEAEVKDAARILTGWRVDLYRTWAPSYSTVDHWLGPVSVMGFSSANLLPDGREVTRTLLSHLAHHPATARRIANKLVRQFVSDVPSEALVGRLAATYLANDTAIAPVLRELVGSAEFAASVDQKLRDPDEDVIATYRLLGASVAPPTGDSSAANQVYWTLSSLGLAPWNWPRPDGQPVDAVSWSSPSRALASMSFHWWLAGGQVGATDVSFPTPVSHLPQRKILLRDLVDHLSRQLLHRPATKVLVQACCEAVELDPKTIVTRKTDLFTWRWQRLVAAILDSPSFYHH